MNHCVIPEQRISLRLRGDVDLIRTVLVGASVREVLVIRFVLVNVVEIVWEVSAVVDWRVVSVE
jgi:hypothetical protein